MNEYEKLEKEFRQKVKELQKSCPHTDVTDWYEEFSEMQRTDFYLKRCRNCEKIVEYKRPCEYCGKILISDEDDRWFDSKYFFSHGWFCSEEHHQKWIQARDEWDKKIDEEIENAKKENRAVVIKSPQKYFGKCEQNAERNERRS